MKLIDFLTNYYAPSRINLGQTTLRHMERSIRTLCRSLGREVKANELGELLIVVHMKWLLQEKYSKQQINVRRGYLMALWKLAYKRKIVSENPADYEIQTVRVPKKKPIAWSIEQIDIMLHQAAQFRPRGMCEFGSREWTSLILLLYYTGLRINAALRLQRSSLQGRLLYVPSEIQKDDEDALIQLPNDLVNLLLSLRRPDIVKHGRKISDMLIPWPWGLTDPQRRLLNHILKPAGLPHNHLLKFHAFRKTTATLVAAHSGVTAAQSLLGHSSSAVTQRYLADPSQVDPSLKSNFSPADVMPVLKVI